MPPKETLRHDVAGCADRPCDQREMRQELFLAPACGRHGNMPGQTPHSGRNKVYAHLNKTQPSGLAGPEGYSRRNLKEARTALSNLLLIIPWKPRPVKTLLGHDLGCSTVQSPTPLERSVAVYGCQSQASHAIRRLPATRSAGTLSATTSGPSAASTRT